MKPLNKRTTKKIEDFATKQMPKMLDQLIYNTEDGGWVIYRRYYIYKVEGLFQVLRTADESVHKFSRLKHATAWSILDHHCKMTDAKRVHELDGLLASVDLERKQHERKKNSGDLAAHIIYTNKIQFDTIRQKQFQSEMDKYIITADNCQKRGFKK